MHVFDEDDGPTVTLVLPRRVAEAMADAVYRFVPGSDRIDGTVDELRAQLAEQLWPEGELPTLPGAVVRATVDGEKTMLCLMPETENDVVPWRSQFSWYSDEELSDVEVLFPGVPS